MKGMYTCKHVSQIVSQSLDKKLPFWTRVQLWMHLGMCGLCNGFRKTMIRVDREFKLRADEAENGGGNSEPQISNAARERMAQVTKNRGQ